MEIYMYDLYIKQKVFKITDHYEVMDVNQRPVYQVDQDFRFIGNKVHVSRMDGTEAFVVNREVLTILPKFTVEFSDGRTAYIKKNFTFFKKSIDMISDNYSLRLEGNFWDVEFAVFNGITEVGNIRKQIFAWGDTFVITVFDAAFEEELIALLIAVDNIKDMENKN